MLEGITNLIGNKEHKQAMEAEQRERSFVRERDTFRSAMDNDTANLEAQRSDLLKWQQDLGDEMELLKHRLLSEELTEKGWQPKVLAQKTADGKVVWVKIPPMANELFVDYIQTQAEPFVSRNLLNSNFTEERILQILRSTCNDIASAMANGFDYYDINFENFDLVMRLIKNTIIPGPFRAMNDGERKHARTISKRVESFNTGREAPSKKGFFGIGG